MPPFLLPIPTRASYLRYDVHRFYIHELLYASQWASPGSRRTEKALNLASITFPFSDVHSMVKHPLGRAAAGCLIKRHQRLLVVFSSVQVPSRALACVTVGYVDVQHRTRTGPSPPGAKARRAAASTRDRDGGALEALERSLAIHTISLDRVKMTGW